MTASKYKPEYCAMLIDHMSKGLSFLTFGAIVNVSQSCLQNWIKTYPEFEEARGIGELHSQQVWEKIGLAQSLGDKDKGKGSAASWIFNMKNRFMWQDKQEIDVGENAKNILTLNYNLDNKDESKDPNQADEDN